MVDKGYKNIFVSEIDLNNAFMVMGINKAFSLADSIKNMGLYLVYANKDGRISDTSNACFKQFLINQ